MYDVIILGAGSAGCAAAIYAKSRDLNILVLEEDKVGGLIRKVSTITHYPGIVEGESGADFVKRIEVQLKDAFIKVDYEKVLSVNLEGDVKTVTTNLNTYEAKAIIIATGTVQNKLAEESEFVSHNALVDGDKYKNSDVVVVGGSDGALKEAIYLSKIANKVYVIHHGEKIAAINDFQRKADARGNVEYILNSEVAGLSSSNGVNSVELKNVKDGTNTTISGENLGVFVFIGSSPETEIYEVEKRDGYIVVNNNMETSIAGVYAAGDIIAKNVRQVSTAVSEGTVAAISANAYLNK